MDAVQQYKSFLNGRYLSEGIRTTIGIVLPSVLMNSLGYLPAGITMSIAALAVSITDVPGPARHRVNGMALCVVVITLMSALTGFTLPYPFLLGALILIAGFVFSMLTVYGMRSSALGVAALYIMVINLDANLSGNDKWMHLVWQVAGALWYFLYSLMLTRIRPYKIIQQVLGDFIISISDYLEKRGDFYSSSPDFNKIYQQLLQHQVEIEKQQALAAELIFKTRSVVKETTKTARVLVKTYLDSSDILESIMTTYQAYDTLHTHFDDLGILSEIREVIFELAHELKEAGIALKAEKRIATSVQLKDKVASVRNHFELLRQTEMRGARIESFLALGRIISNLEDLAEKIETLHRQAEYESRTGLKLSAELPGSYIQSEDIRPSIFLDNLNLKSHAFRHAVRVATSLLAGFIIAHAFNLSHGNWILLTIVVILKPTFSMTRQRNRDRLFGTVIGIVVGVLLLYFIRNESLLLAIMILLMLGSFVWIRTNYFLAVILLTPELIILYHLLIPGDINDVLTHRLFDTAIGSGIAFLSNLLVVPVWEHTGIRDHMLSMIRKNLEYYKTVAGAFTIPESNFPGIRKKRREVLLSLSNLSDAFHRMLSEPKRVQKDMDYLHRFIVLNYSITSHLATLSYYLHQERSPFRSMALRPLISNTILHLEASEKYLAGLEVEEFQKAKPAPVFEEYIANLMERRTSEIAAGHLETDTKQELIAVKSVVDQLQYLQNLSATLAKLSREYK